MLPPMPDSGPLFPRPTCVAYVRVSTNEQVQFGWSMDEQEQSIRLVLQASLGACGYPDQQWTGKRLALHLDKHHDVTMSVRTCQRMILRSRDGPTM